LSINVTWPSSVAVDNVPPMCIPGSAVVCDPKVSYSCVVASLKKYVGGSVASTCNCPPQCTKVTYKYVVTQSEFSNYMINYVQNVYGLNISSKALKQNYAGLEVTSVACSS
jgi:hypothetical protein